MCVSSKGVWGQQIWNGFFVSGVDFIETGDKSAAVRSFYVPKID